MTAKPGPVQFHPAMATTYRTRVRELVTVVSSDLEALEARETIRAFVDRVVLTPSDEDPSQMLVNFEGALAGILRLSLGQPLGALPSANDKAASSSETALQPILVAGAGFEPATFRL